MLTNLCKLKKYLFGEKTKEKPANLTATYYPCETRTEKSSRANLP